MSNEEANVGKGRPTPSRKEAEAANARPLVGNKLDKEQTRARRLQQREARETARMGAIMGDEKYLSDRDRGPQRKIARDLVDSRFNVGELIIPVMVIILLMTLINDPTWQIVSLAFVWGFVGFALIDSVFLGRRVQRILADKYGADKVQPGTKWYVGMRAMQMRSLRVPKPQVKRGTKLDV